MELQLQRIPNNDNVEPCSPPGRRRTIELTELAGGHHLTRPCILLCPCLCLCYCTCSWPCSRPCA